MGYKENFAAIDWSKPLPPIERHASDTRHLRADLSAPMIVSDYEAYECPVTGKMIEGRRAHSENLKQTDCRLLEPGEFEDTKKNGQKRIHEKMDAAIDAAVDEIAPTLTI